MRKLIATVIACLAGCDSLQPREEHREEEPAERMVAPPEAGIGHEWALPPDPELLAQIEKAMDLKLRDDFDRFLDAREPGELVEHATLTQPELDRVKLGIDALFVFGDELFDYEFRPENGLGNGLQGRSGILAGKLPAPNLRRVHNGEFGGPDSHNCSGCHLKGGTDGAGNNTQNAYLRSDGSSTILADVRNPPHVLGLGPVEALAREMSSELQDAKARAIEEARQGGKPVDARLETKGVGFGIIRALPDGTVDGTRLEGIDADLVIKPFGWKGHQATIRGMAEESFRIHLGIVSMHDQARFRDGQASAAIHGDGTWYDMDRDGMTIELDEGMLTTIVVYLSQLEAPVIRPPQAESLADHFARGQSLYEEVKCDSCHRPLLGLKNPVLEILPRGAEASGKEPIRVNVAFDGELPKIEPQNASRTAFNVRLFSDLKRHDMGPDLASPGAQAGIGASVFLTRSLWGLGFTAPYLHDGRAPTVDDAIRLHGGEAAASRDLYLALDPGDRAAIQVYLLSLTREPKLFVP